MSNEQMIPCVIGGDSPLPKYSFEITTSAKGLHSFSVKVRGEDLDATLSDLKKSTDAIGSYVERLNEGVKG
mgnify:CR=1 FL=1